MAIEAGSLSSFHPLVRDWFLSRYGRPTPVQEAAWPLIASGEHVLALAPTGSGKTLAAFLGAISRIASGELPSEGVSVLYVSPASPASAVTLEEGDSWARSRLSSNRCRPPRKLEAGSA